MYTKPFSDAACQQRGTAALARASINVVGTAVRESFHLAEIVGFCSTLAATLPTHREG